MTSPASKAKRSPAERLARRIARAFKAKRVARAHRMTPEELTALPPRVRLAGAELKTFQVACGEGMHRIHVIRKNDTVKAIITPCGIPAARAAWNLGGDTCYKAVALIQSIIGDRPGVVRDTQLRVDERGLLDATGVVYNAIGGSDTLNRNKRLRRERIARMFGKPWDRSKLTRAALPTLIAQAAPPGTKITIEGRRVYVQVPGTEMPSCCVYDTGSWGVGPGPQAPDSVFAVLKCWTKVLAANTEDIRGPNLTGPGAVSEAGLPGAGG